MPFRANYYCVATLAGILMPVLFIGAGGQPGPEQSQPQTQYVLQNPYVPSMVSVLETESWKEFAGKLSPLGFIRDFAPQQIHCHKIDLSNTFEPETTLLNISDSDTTAAKPTLQHQFVHSPALYDNILYFRIMAPKQMAVPQLTSMIFIILGNTNMSSLSQQKSIFSNLTTKRSDTSTRLKAVDWGKWSLGRIFQGGMSKAAVSF